MPETEKYQLRVTLLGMVTLENQWGRVEENPSRQSLPWLLMKYLLHNRARAVTQEELLSVLWPDKPQVDGVGASRVRLRRLREALAPLHLDGKSGLVQYAAGKYRLNPRYTLCTDADRFLDLLDRLHACPPEDPAGLPLCVQALELFAGPYLENTAPAGWMTPYRDYFRRAFCTLARDTLDRTLRLKDSQAVPLLCLRAAAIVPEEEDLHRAILRYLVEEKQELELLRYVSRLSHAGGEGTRWLKTLEEGGPAVV